MIFQSGFVQLLGFDIDSDQSGTVDIKSSTKARPPPLRALRVG